MYDRDLCVDTRRLRKLYLKHEQDPTTFFIIFSKVTKTFTERKEIYIYIYTVYVPT